MIIFTIVISALALLAARATGVTETRLGTAAITAIILLFVISALPQCYWLFDSIAGWLATLALWATSTVFYHRILADGRRPAPMGAASRRHALAWQFGRQRLVIAYVWSAA